MPRWGALAFWSATGGKRRGIRSGGDSGFSPSSVMPHYQSCGGIRKQDLCSKKSDSRVSVDHKLTRTGCDRGGATPLLLGQPDGYLLSPGLFTKEWKLLGGLGVTQAGRGEGDLSFRADLPKCTERGDTLESLASALLHPGVRPLLLTCFRIGPGSAQTVNGAL